MRKNFLKILAIVLSIIFILLVGVLVYMKTINNKEKGKKDDLSAKVIDEISFINYNVIDAMNKLNNISVVRYKVYTKNINNSSKSANNSTKNSSDASSNSEQGNGSSQNAGNSEGENQGQKSGEKANQDAEKSNSQEGSSGLSSDNSEETTMNGNNSKQSETNLVNSLTESDSKEIDWDVITNIYENLFTTWTTTVLDLKQSGISDEYIENVNIDLNGIAQSIINKDKNSCLVNLYNLYAQLPGYIETISKDDYLTTLYNTKMAILNAYTLSNNDNKWNEISSSVKSAKEQFGTLLSRNDIDENNKINLEKVYSMLQNLESAVALNNKNIFHMQYKNVLQEIECL